MEILAIIVVFSKWMCTVIVNLVVFEIMNDDPGSEFRRSLSSLVFGLF